MSNFRLERNIILDTYRISVKDKNGEWCKTDHEFMYYQEALKELSSMRLFEARIDEGNWEVLDV